MPLYEFHCQDCGKDFEALTRSSDWRGTTCPSCQSTRLVKKLSIFSAPSGGSEVGAGDSCGPSCGLSDSGGGCCGGACGLN